MNAASAFIYFDLLFINPIKINLTFTSAALPPDTHLCDSPSFQ